MSDYLFDTQGTSLKTVHSLTVKSDENLTNLLFLFKSGLAFKD